MSYRPTHFDFNNLRLDAKIARQANQAASQREAARAKEALDDARNAAIEAEASASMVEGVLESEIYSLSKNNKRLKTSINELTVERDAALRIAEKAMLKATVLEAAIQKVLSVDQIQSVKNCAQSLLKDDDFLVRACFRAHEELTDALGRSRYMMFGDKGSSESSAEQEVKDRGLYASRALLQRHVMRSATFEDFYSKLSQAWGSHSSVNGSKNQVSGEELAKKISSFMEALESDQEKIELIREKLQAEASDLAKADSSDLWALDMATANVPPILTLSDVPSHEGLLSSYMATAVGLYAKQLAIDEALISLAKEKNISLVDLKAQLNQFVREWTLTDTAKNTLFRSEKVSILEAAKTEADELGLVVQPSVDVDQVRPRGKRTP